jgi:hypothetical protein
LGDIIAVDLSPLWATGHWPEDTFGDLQQRREAITGEKLSQVNKVRYKIKKLKI